MRVLIAEDQPLLRDALATLVASFGHEVVAAVGDAEAALAASRAGGAGRDGGDGTDAAPELLLLDVRMPPTGTDDGIRVALAARRERPGLPVVLLSQYVELLYLDDLLADERGGVGYLLKNRAFGAEAFKAALETVAAGGTVVDPEVIGQLLAKQRNASALDALTPREREVLAHMAEGESNARIALALTVTEKAVQKHINAIFTKLDLPPDAVSSRRVRAVLEYLRGSGRAGDA